MPAILIASGKQWNAGKLAAEEQKTLAMATEELKDMLQYGHLELADKTMDPRLYPAQPQRPPGSRWIQAVHESCAWAHPSRNQNRMG
jgi:hypothetical protein